MNTRTHEALGTVLVTGGAGYIGSHVAVELAGVGHTPIILDNFSNSAPSAVDGLRRVIDRPVTCITGDIRDADLLRRVFRDHAITAVVHCAGLKAVGEGESEPLAYYDNNVGGTIALLDAMATANVNTLVFSSSATVYGEPAHNPIDEAAPLQPQSVYGRTKRIVEQVLQDLSASNPAWHVALLRYFNPAGAHPSAFIGEAASGTPNNLVPFVADVAAGVRDEIAVFGNDWPTPDGTGVRDYIHVVDLAGGHVAALAHLVRTPGVTTLNLGTGRPYSVLELIAAFERACGKSLKYRITARRPGDIATCYADPSRAERVLGWRARRDLDSICADAWRWQQAR